MVEAVGKGYELHPLLLEDIVNTEQRPKLDDYGSYLFLVLKMLYRQPGGQTINAEQVSLVAGPGLVLSFQENGSDVFGPTADAPASAPLRAVGTNVVLAQAGAELPLFGSQVHLQQQQFVGVWMRLTLHNRPNTQLHPRKIVVVDGILCRIHEFG
jgi:hypothetical protein